MKKIMHSKNKNFIKKQCGFDTTTKDAAEIFDIAIEANKYLRKHSKYGWRNIETFFYLLGS